jgi:uncharacterized damage-inducible protein DinB
MIHPLVAQLFFTRSEFERGLHDLSPDDAKKKLGPMNCISWIIGHMAWHEQKYWLDLMQGKVLYPDLYAHFAFGSPKSTPGLDEVLKYWRDVTRESVPRLEKFTTADMQADLLRHGKSVGQSHGSAMQRIIYHYWYHTGEIQSIRQLLGHQQLAVYVGDIEEKAPYRSEYMP